MADLTVNPDNVYAFRGATTSLVQAGEVILAGQPVYKHTDGKYYKADSNVEAKAEAKGIALSNSYIAATTDDDAFFIILKRGGLYPGVAVVKGQTYYVSPDAGGIQPATDVAAADYVTILGVASSTSRIDIDIKISGALVA